MSEFLEHYAEILADPAHLAVEVTLMLVVDGLFLGLVWPFIKRHIHRDIDAEHHLIDAEHGITHHRARPEQQPGRQLGRDPRPDDLVAPSWVYDHEVHGL